MKIVTVVGARPQFVKAFALSHALADAPDFDEVLLHTGQHFDDNMSAVFFSELKIRPPRHHFSIHGGTHATMTARMLEAIESVLVSESPEAVIVYGDTNSTLAGALAAAKLAVPVVHIEAGLRSFNRTMPEEINRVVADHLGDLLFCPTRVARANLAREGIERDVHLVGDVMYDATLLAAPIAERNSRILETLGLSPGGYSVATIHRAANTAEPRILGEILDYIATAADGRPAVLPLHPRTAAAAARMGLQTHRDGLRIVGPLGYLDMSRLLQHAALVLTDSGGVQKEAYFHRVPCVTLRDETEWTETVECGWNRLWRTRDYRPRREIEDYGSGHASAEIVRILRAFLLARR